jgi:hypothetical protein
LLAAVVVATGLGASVSVIAFDLAREANPPERGGTATGVVNIGGFACAVLADLVIGWLLAGVAAAVADGLSADRPRVDRPRVDRPRVDGPGLTERRDARTELVESVAGERLQDGVLAWRQVDVRHEARRLFARDLLRELVADGIARCRVDDRPDPKTRPVEIVIGNHHRGHDAVVGWTLQQEPTLSSTRAYFRLFPGGAEGFSIPPGSHAFQRRSGVRTWRSGM